MDFLKLQIVEQQHLIDELSKVPARPVPPHSAAGPPAPGRACPPAPPERSASPPLDQRDRLGSPGRDGAEGLTPLLSLDPAGAGRAPKQGPCPGEASGASGPIPRLSSRGSGFFSAHSATRLRAGLLSASMSSRLFPNEPTVPGSGGWGVSLSFLGPHPLATSSPGPRQWASARRPVTQLRALSASSLGSNRLHGQSSSEQAASALCALGTQRALSVAGVAQGMYGGGWLQGHGHPELLQVLGALGGIGSGRVQGWGAGGGGGAP